MKKIAILQSNYIPWRGYFDLINKVDVFVVYDEVQYTKNDWRNRNIIKTPNGPMWLTIPVRQLNLEQKINETRVSLKNWNIKHWNSIKANYTKAPYFKRYEEQFKELYLGMDTEMLSEINLKFIRAINDILGIQTEIIDSISLNLNGNKNERLVDAVTKLNGTHYLSGPAAKDYLDTNLFEKNNIQVEWMDYSGYSDYKQLYNPFLKHVSVIDYIFNTSNRTNL
jgi:hypothetical protein